MTGQVLTGQVLTGQVLTGAGVVSAAGIGWPALTTALAERTRLVSDLSGLYEETLPYPAAHALAGFDVRALLGRKGTSSLDRASGLALVACGQALADSTLRPDGEVRERVGVALGTTVGSLRSSSLYSRETLVAERPYLVNPMLFPSTVMNCAAGQTAIWHGLKGVNSTLAGGRLGFLGALRYGSNMLRRGYADAMLVGAVEEFTPQSAWSHYLTGARGLPGEAAAFFVLERESTALAAGRKPLATLAATAAGFQPGGGQEDLADRLAVAVSQVLRQAGLAAGQLGAIALTEPGGAADEEVSAAIARALWPAEPEDVGVRDVLGDCGAAGAALQFAALLARCRDASGTSGGYALIAGWTPEGAFTVAVLRS
jgi:3-oxoacyl-[acyl-carrier-protein] synthase II